MLLGDRVHVIYILYNCAVLFKGAAKSVNTDGESRIFWLSLVVSEVFWVMFVFAALITLSFKWFVSDHVLSLSIASCIMPCFGQLISLSYRY